MLLSGLAHNRTLTLYWCPIGLASPVTGFRRRRFLAALTLKHKDRELDALTDEVSERLVERGTEVPRTMRTYQVTRILSSLPCPGAETMVRNR